MNRLVTSVRFAFLLFVVFAAVGSDASAQHDSRGRIFWVTFMANLGTGPSSSDLRIYLAADTPTTARIVYFGTNDTIVVPIPLARTSVEVDISAIFGSWVELDEFDEITPKAIQVIVDDTVEVSCYGVNIRGKSADAFLSLPDDVLTNAYIVLAYPNALANWQTDDGLDTQLYDQPSQFAIVATEDGTTVEINPSARVKGRPRQPYTVVLDRGDVYNGQADTGYAQDVSGTEIKSNKPIAVFAGNRRTAIPLSVGNFRDHLVEQIPPLAIWGREAIITPHFPITQASRQTAVVRVLAAFDNTTWSINGRQQPMQLARAVPIEIPLNGAMSITASGPILVAQYEHSVDKYDPSNQFPEPGDPFMMIVPPTEQFAYSYSFQAISHSEFVNFGHYTNVVIPTQAINSVLLDGGPVVATWQPVPTTRFSFAQVHLTPGSHHIQADSALGIYSYGFGPASSYGYPGGMLFKTLVHDFQPPGMLQEQDCDGLDGFAFDSQITDSGIDSVYLHSSSRNVVASIDPFVRGADTVRYRVNLVDPYLDGIATMKAVDSIGRSVSRTLEIAGLTVRAVGSVANQSVTLDTLELFNGKGGCVAMVLENYGKFPQTFARVDIVPANPALSIDVRQPLTLLPGERVTVNLCAVGMPDTILQASLVLIGSCSERTPVMVPIEAWTDTMPPVISSTDITCSRDFTISFSKHGAKVSRITEVSFDTLINARFVDQTPSDLGSPADHVEVRLAAIDQYRDMIYQVRTRDEAGNEGVWRDTVGGFTVTVLDGQLDSVSQRFDRDLRMNDAAPGEDRCDSVTIANYGARTMTLTRLSFNGNQLYSVPPAQLPFVIPPHSQRRLQICFEGRETGISIDTMRMTDACGREDALVVKLLVPVVTATDRCNNALSVSSYGASKRTFLMTPHPNPVTGAAAAVDIGLAGDAVISLDVLDAAGETASVVMRKIEMSAGLHRISFDVSALGNGSYYCRLRTATGEQYVEKIVVRR